MERPAERGGHGRDQDTTSAEKGEKKKKREEGKSARVLEAWFTDCLSALPPSFLAV